MFEDKEYFDRNLNFSAFYEKSYMHQEIINIVESTAATNFISTCSLDGKIKIWRKMDGDIEFVKQYKAHKGKINCFCFSKCGKYGASVSGKDNSLKIYDIVNADMIGSVELQFCPSKCVFFEEKKTKNAGLLITEYSAN